MSSKLLAMLDLGREEWRPPAVDGWCRAAALAALAELEPMLNPADRALVERWLGSLGVLTAGGRMTADDAKTKCRLYAAMLDYPAGCFTKDTLCDVARFLTFFPSFAELCGELEKARVRLERMRARLTLLAADPPPPPAPRARLSEDCAKQLGDLAAELAAKARPVFLPSQRAPSEGSREPITTVRGRAVAAGEGFAGMTAQDALAAHEEEAALP